MDKPIIFWNCEIVVILVVVMMMVAMMKNQTIIRRKCITKHGKYSVDNLASLIISSLQIAHCKKVTTSSPSLHHCIWKLILWSRFSSRAFGLLFCYIIRSNYSFLIRSPRLHSLHLWLCSVCMLCVSECDALRHLRTMTASTTATTTNTHAHFYNNCNTTLYTNTYWHIHSHTQIIYTLNQHLLVSNMMNHLKLFDWCFLIVLVWVWCVIQVELENWVNSIHNACAAAFARHRGKTGTLHLLQEEIYRLERAIESVSF